MKNNQAFIKKIGTNFQVTIPNKYRKQLKLDVGSLIKLHMENNKLIVEPLIENRTEILTEIQSILDELHQAPPLADSEQSIMKMVVKEIKTARAAKK